MSHAPNCPRCGAVLAADAPQGLCPECLLKVGMESESAGGSVPGSADAGRGPPCRGSGEATTESFAGHGDRRGQKTATVLPRSGERFGNYRIVRQLGKGGMGVVFEADDLESGRRVALKLLAHSLESPEARNRFFREGRLAASINHPHCVYVYGTGEIDGTPIISMEHIAGGTLHDRVKREGPLPVTEAVDVILEIIDGLEAAAKVGVLHRDVKPSNCFVDGDGTVKVGDFGLSISTTARGETHLTQAGSLLGTPAFASPEQLRGDELDIRSDIYAVGTTLFYLLTGCTPYDAESLVKLLATVLEQPPPSPKKFRPGIPQGLARAVTRCLSKHPSDRFRTYAALREALMPYNSTAPTPATLALRVVAGVIDHGIWTVAVLLAQWAWVGDFDALVDPKRMATPAFAAWVGIATVLNALYFALPEGLLGASPGKALLRLRVVDRDRRLIGVPRALLRTAIFLLVPNVIVWTYWIAQGGFTADMEKLLTENPTHFLISTLVAYTYFVMLAVLFSTARRHNGYSGLHDLATGARVIRRESYAARPVLSRDEPPLPDTVDKETVGPYHVLDTLEESASEEFLLGYDARHLRRVWIHRRPAGAPPVSEQRRSLGRIGRLRWINAGRAGDETWDAYEALSGAPLAVLASEPQPWDSVRYWLLDLAAELAAAEDDGSLPESLDLDRVWITADGRAKLLDFPAPGMGETASLRVFAAADASPDSTSNSAPRFLRRVASSALEGTGRSGEGGRSASFATRLPVAASAFLDRLPALGLDEAADELKTLARQVPAVTRSRRFGVLAATALFPLLFALCGGFGTWLVAYMEAREPELAELRDVMICMQWKRDRPPSPAVDENARQADLERREAFETYIAGRFREAMQDSKKREGYIGRMVLAEPYRSRAEEIIGRRPPSKEEFERAAAVVEQDMKEYHKLQEEFPFRSPLTIMAVNFVTMWILFVMLPGLAAAVFFRRGLVLRTLGVDYVARTGRPASRLRMLWRMILLNVPVALAPLWMAMLYPLVADAAAAILAVVAVVVAITVVSCLLPERGLADRLSGTYPVPG
jgi:uncharacterized RDD family membrane protein YckC